MMIVKRVLMHGLAVIGILAAMTVYVLASVRAYLHRRRQSRPQ